MSAKNFFNEAQIKDIVASIEAAELNTSGEIRLHLVDNCAGDPKNEAIAVFEKLGMTNTELRNGVLIYLAVEDKKFAIVGDKGINDLVPDNFWDSVRDIMISEFKLGNFAEGIKKGLHETGLKLKEHFPYTAEDENELSNDISYE